MRTGYAAYVELSFVYMHCLMPFQLRHPYHAIDCLLSEHGCNHQVRSAILISTSTSNTSVYSLCSLAVVITVRVHLYECELLLTTERPHSTM